MQKTEGVGGTYQGLGTRKTGVRRLIARGEAGGEARTRRVNMRKGSHVEPHGAAVELLHPHVSRIAADSRLERNENVELALENI